MAHAHPASIYGVIEREFRSLNQPVVKLGKTSRPLHHRLSDYPNGSVMLFAFNLQIGSEDVVEAALLVAARKQFKHRPDLGAEYFEGDPTALTILAAKVASGFLPTEYGGEAEADAEAEGVADESSNVDMDLDLGLIRFDPEVQVMRFVNEFKENLCKQTVRSDTVHNQYFRFITRKSLGKPLKLLQFVATLKKCFKVESSLLDLDGAVRHVITFPRLTVCEEVPGDPVDQFSAVRKFVADHVVPQPGRWFTLKMAKELFEQRDYYIFVGKPKSLKLDLERALGTACHDQKRMDGRKEVNVFEGFALVEDSSSPDGPDPVGRFVNEHIERKPGSWFALADAREVFKGCSYYNRQPKMFKARLQRALGVVCYEQKKIGGRNETNVFEGFAIVLPTTVQ
jgi:hypothetical protein